jgi:hypothetical protein
MSIITIKGVPERTYAGLQQRALANQQSLEEYVLHLLKDVADQSTLDDVFKAAGAESRGSVTVDDINAIIRADRDSH